MTNPSPDPLDAPTAALAAAVLEIARHVEGEPLAAPRWFALAHGAQLLAQQPGLAALLGEESAAVMAGDELQLISIELDETADADSADPLHALAHVEWPEMAAGGVLACDLAPEQWSVREEDDTSAATPGAVSAHGTGGTGPLRIVVGALEDGTTWSALQRDGDQQYTLGAALLPDLTAALLESLQPAS